MRLRQLTPRVAVLALLSLSAAGAARAQGRPAALLDGRTLAGWQQTGSGRFVVEADGSIVSDGGPGLLYHTRRLRDFVLELEYRADSPTAESGIFLRLPPPTQAADAAKAGYEVQIRDVLPGAPAAAPAAAAAPGQPRRPPARPDYNRMTGAIAGITAVFRPMARPVGEWNRVRVEVAGQRYRVSVNGELVADYVGDRAREGHIALENSGPESKVRFRNVRVTPLTGAAPESLADALRPARAPGAPIRVLVVTATQGFRHSESIDASKPVLKELERTTEFRFDLTEDLSAISAANLANYDVLFLNNATLRAAPANPSDTAAVRLHRTAQVAAPLTVEQQRAIADFVRNGKGLASVHSGIDANYGWAEYREMLGGGLFRAHPWTQPGRLRVEDRANPAVSHFGDGFWMRDEMYVLDQNPRSTSHVLLSLDMPSVGEAAGSQDHPMAFVRRHGQGRVFVTVLGHFGDNWRRPDFVQHVLQGLRIAAGRLPADFSPTGTR